MAADDKIEDLNFNLEAARYYSLIDLDYYSEQAGGVLFNNWEEARDHYNSVGWKQGLNPSQLFDGTAYLAANPDVVALNTSPLKHYVETGMAEHRGFGGVADESGFIFDVATGVPQSEVDTIKSGLAIAQDFAEEFLGGKIPESVTNSITIKMEATGQGNQEPGGGGGVATGLSVISDLLPRPYFDVAHAEWGQDSTGRGWTTNTDNLKVVVHEYIHGWQAYLGAMSIYRQPLGNWVQEGIAEYVAYSAMEKMGLLTHSDVLSFQTSASVATGELAQTLESLGTTSTSVWPGHIGYLAIDWLVDESPHGLTSLRILTDRIAAGDTTAQAFKTAFDIDLDDFYAQFELWRPLIVSDYETAQAVRPELLNLSETDQALEVGASIPTLSVSFENGFDAHIDEYSRISVDPNGDANFDYSQVGIEKHVREGWAFWFEAMPNAVFAGNANIEVKIQYVANGGSSVAFIDVPDYSDPTYSGIVPSVFHELVTGQDSNGTSFDAVISVGPDLGTRYGGISGVMAHEFGHALGFLNGENHVFDNLSSNGYFWGESAVALYGGPVPVQGGGHLINPAKSIMGGDSVGVSSLDIAVLQDLGLFANGIGDSQANTVKGSAFGDLIALLSGDDVVIGGGGNDSIDGGSGVDTAKYAGTATHFSVTINKGSATIVTDRKGIEGTDSLLNVENIDFQTGTKDINLDILDGVVNVSSSDLLAFIEMYIAYFNRAPDAEGLFYWGTRLSEGMSKEQIAKSFYVQPETQALYPNPDDTEGFVTSVYNNFLGRAPDAEGFAYWVNELDTGSISQPLFLLAIINGAKAATGNPDDVDYFTNKANIGAYFSVIKGMSDTDNAKTAMALYDGTAGSITTAKNQIDSYYNAALDANNGELLINLVGVMDDPFAA